MIWTSTFISRFTDEVRHIDVVFGTQYPVYKLEKLGTELFLCNAEDVHGTPNG